MEAAHAVECQSKVQKQKVLTSALALIFNPAVVRNQLTHFHVHLQIASSSKDILALVAFESALMGALICEPVFGGPSELP